MCTQKRNCWALGSISFSGTADDIICLTKPTSHIASWWNQYNFVRINRVRFKARLNYMVYLVYKWQGRGNHKLNNSRTTKTWKICKSVWVAYVSLNDLWSANWTGDWVVVGQVTTKAIGLFWSWSYSEFLRYQKRRQGSFFFFFFVVEFDPFLGGHYRRLSPPLPPSFLPHSPSHFLSNFLSLFTTWGYVQNI